MYRYKIVNDVQKEKKWLGGYAYNPNTKGILEHPGPHSEALLRKGRQIERDLEWNACDMKAEGGLLEVGEGPAKGGRDNRRQWEVYG